MKKRNIITSLLLVFLILFGVLACNRTDPAQSTTTPESNTTVSTSEDDPYEYDANGFRKDNLGTMNFGGKEIVISGWSETSITEYEVDPTTIGADRLDDSIYLRNRTVESRLSVKLKYILDEGWLGGGNYNMTQIAKIRSLAGSKEIDITATYSWAPALLITEGIITDLKTLPHLDFTAPWWYSNMVESCSVYDSLYFCTGDISPSSINATFCIYYNKLIAENNALETDLYDMVNDGTWTLAQMITIAKTFGTDVNSDGKKDENDKFGYASSHTTSDAFYWASGLMTLTQSLDGSMIVSDDFGSLKTHSLISTLVDFIDHENILMDDLGTPSKAWNNGNVLFYLSDFSAARGSIEKGIIFGLLPVPKYDTDQDNYITTLGFYYTLYSVMRDVQNGDKEEAVGATLECLASESYRLVTPEYYEKILKTSYSDSVNEYPMWDVIKESVVIDSGRVYTTSLSRITYERFRMIIKNRDKDWVSVYSTHIGTLNDSLKTINKIILQYQTVYGN